MSRFYRRVLCESQELQTDSPAGNPWDSMAY